MYDFISTAAARIGSVDPLALLFLVGCVGFLWMIWKVVADDRDLRGHAGESLESPAGASPAARDQRATVEGPTGRRPTGGRPSHRRAA